VYVFFFCFFFWFFSFFISDPTAGGYIGRRLVAAPIPASHPAVARLLTSLARDHSLRLRILTTRLDLTARSFLYSQKGKVRSADIRAAFARGMCEISAITGRPDVRSVSRVVF
jgi:hypothetical protein